MSEKVLVHPLASVTRTENEPAVIFILVESVEPPGEVPLAVQAYVYEPTPPETEIFIDPSFPLPVQVGFTLETKIPEIIVAGSVNVRLSLVVHPPVAVIVTITLPTDNTPGYYQLVK